MQIQFAAFVLVIIAAWASARAATQPGTNAALWTPPNIELQSPMKHPAIAATPEELARLRAAWKGTGPEHDVLAERFARANAAIKEGIHFPPGGGQHNQWYQCEKCQVALKTVDATHHQCPKCNVVYSGFPFDNVLYSKQHTANASRAEDAAWAYSATGEKKYADLAATVLIGYADRYLKYPMLVNSVNDKNVDVAALKATKYRSAGRLDNQTLGEAMLMVRLAVSYDLVYHSGAFSPEQKAHVEKNLFRAMIDNININTLSKSNWQTWHNAASIYAGAALGDEELIRRAILDESSGLVLQMVASVSDEGMWYENSWGYHYYTLMALTHMAEGSRRLGINLYDHPKLKRMYLLAFDYQMADGSLPRFGDGVQDGPVRPGVNEPAYAVYRDPRLLATLGDKPTFESVLLGREMSASKVAQPPATSILFPGAGHAILRTDGPGKLSAAMTFGPFGGFHGHFDKNTFALFGFGEELGVDPGRAASQAYRLPIHRDWYRATTSHNGVLVDQQGQIGADGKLISFGRNRSYAAVAADTGTAFANVSHKRLLLLTPTYLLVVDDLRATDGKAHAFDWLYHNRGKDVRIDAPEAKHELGAAPGYKYLSHVKSYDAHKEGIIRAEITDRGVTTHVVMVAEKGDVAFSATGPVRDVDDRAGMLIVRRKGEHGMFVTVIEPAKGAGLVRSVAMTDQAGGVRVSVEQGEQHDEVVTSAGFAEVTVTTGRGASVREMIRVKK